MPRKSASGSAKPLRKADNRRGGYVGSALSSNAEPAYRNAAAKAPTTTTQVRGAQRLGNAVARYVPDVSVSVNGKTYGGREQLAGSIRNTALGGIGAPNNAQRGGKVTQTGNWVYDTLVGGDTDTSSYNPQIGSRGSATRKGMVSKRAKKPAGKTPVLPPNPNPRIEGTVAYEQGQKGPTGGAGTDIMWASVPDVGTKRKTSVRVQTPAGGGRTALKGAGIKKGKEDRIIGPPRASEQKQALPPKERVHGGQGVDVRGGPKPAVRNAMKGATASLKKDITSAFVENRRKNGW